MLTRLVLSSLCLSAIALTACGGDDAPRRSVAITQTDDSCTPATVDVAMGEKLTLEVQNTSSKDQEIEGIEGTKLEEVLIPAGKTRSVKFTAADSAGTQKLKCYAPKGQTTVIEVKVS